MRALALAIAAAVGLAVAPRAASAQEAPEPVVADRWVDGAIVGGSALAALALSRIPVDVDRVWERELFGSLDLTVRDNVSATAASISDMLLAMSIVAPAFMELGGGIDSGSDDRLLIYAESLAITGALTSAAKHLVQRPRPYTYNRDPHVVAFAAAEGKDSRMSFYSGHAALSFAAGISGGYLYASRSDDVDARTAVWASGAVLASTTSLLRVRAGKHFYSDIAIGAVIGVGLGYAIPRLHHDGGISLEPQEWAGLAGGVLVGATLGLLVPMPDNVVVDLGGAAAKDLELQPLSFEGGAGLAIGGVLD